LEEWQLMLQLLPTATNKQTNKQNKTKTPNLRNDFETFCLVASNEFLITSFALVSYTPH
jgi:hypothetical protein